MGQFVSRVHNKQDDKLYNILPMGDMPTVVFGRVIREHSVPGMQYYFSDGRVKYHIIGESTKGYDYTIPFRPDKEESDVKFGYACIFTVPEDFNFSQMSNVEYVKQYCRTAINLNANTMSPDFIIRNGKIVCIKKNIDGYIRVRYYRKNRTRRRGGRRYSTSNVISGGFNPAKTFKSRIITVIPIGKRRASSLSVFQYDYRQKWKTRGNYNLHGHCYDDNNNIGYFRLSKIRGAHVPEDDYVWEFRVSEFENLDNGWQNNFDFNNTVKYGDILTVDSRNRPAIQEIDFYNLRIDKTIRVFVDSTSGATKIKKKWLYFQM